MCTWAGEPIPKITLYIAHTKNLAYAKLRWRDNCWAQMAQPKRTETRLEMVCLPGPHPITLCTGESCIEEMGSTINLGFVADACQFSSLCTELPKPYCRQRASTETPSSKAAQKSSARAWWSPSMLASSLAYHCEGKTVYSSRVEKECLTHTNSWDPVHGHLAITMQQIYHTIHHKGIEGKLHWSIKAFHTSERDQHLVAQDQNWSPWESSSFISV